MNVNIDKNYSDHVACDVRVTDASKAYSMQISMTNVVLNPCVHRSCVPGANFPDVPSSSEKCHL